MQKTKTKEMDESKLTEQDLMLSFSKDYDWKQWVKSSQRVEELDEKTVKKKVKKKSNRAKFQTSLSDVTSFMNLSVFSIPEQNESDLTSSAGTNRISNMRQYSENPLPNYFDGVNRKSYLFEEQTKNENQRRKKEENEESRAGPPHRFPLKDNEDEDIKTRIRELGNKIRKYTVQCNRLKYLLRKDSQAQTEQQSLETRQCPCCGKYISKLCFKCEHLYCNPENCPRKKKQRLNARMLEKMKEKMKQKVKDDDHEKTHSRSRNKTSMLRRKRTQQDPEGSFHTSDEESFTEDDLLISESQEKEETDPALQGYRTRRSTTKPVPAWKMTMSSIGESKLFISDGEES